MLVANSASVDVVKLLLCIAFDVVVDVYMKLLLFIAFDVVVVIDLNEVVVRCAVWGFATLFSFSAK
jgi:hypothetical protein